MGAGRDIECEENAFAMLNVCHYSAIYYVVICVVVYIYIGLCSDVNVCTCVHVCVCVCASLTVYILSIFCPI